MVTVKIENAYEDGHESEHVVKITEPRGRDLDAWFEESVYPHTGDGHGIDGLGSCYVATIIAADDAELLGKSYEWTD